MRGNIYAKEKCMICGSSFKNDENQRGCFCPNHPEQKAHNGFIVRFGRDISKYHKNYDDAYRFLTGLRYEVDSQKFDPRDYKSDKPLGFENQAEKFLVFKKNKVDKDTFKHLQRYMHVAIGVWGSRNIKTIHYAEINDLFISLRAKGLAEKTIANHRSCYNDFFNWVADMENKQGEKSFIAPKVPKIKYKLGTRNIISKNDQARIVEQIKKNTYHINPKIWLGVRWLTIYVAMRPGEMLRLKERDVGIDGLLFLPGKSTKEREPKPIPLLDEDIKILKGMSRGLPDEPFFRWDKDYNTGKAGNRFGRNIFYDHWVKACKQLGITDIDLYGGTRHTTVSSLGQHYSYEEIKEHGTRHTTSKAFDRYFMRGEVKLSRAIYEKADANNNGGAKEVKGKIIPFRKKE